MARKRMIDPNFWSDEKLGECSIQERLLFMGLISNADDEGYGRANPKLLKSLIFPYDDLRASDLEKWLSHLGRLNIVVLFKYDGQTYYLSGERENVKTMFIFDEPTTGLHMHDINTLMRSFDRLIERGHTVVIIEHNMEVIKCADHIIDLGPEGGDQGGDVVVTGTPEQVAQHPTSYTGKFLRKCLEAEPHA